MLAHSASAAGAKVHMQQLRQMLAHGAPPAGAKVHARQCVYAMLREQKMLGMREKTQAAHSPRQSRTPHVKNSIMRRSLPTSLVA